MTLDKMSTVSSGHNVSSIFSHLETGIGFESGRIFLAATTLSTMNLKWA